MEQLDREKFGMFLSALRKEKGLTQQEVADRLFVSNKAVSKWERGQSFPDVSLLTPLSELLGVTVTELLKGERLAQERLDRGEVDELVTAAVHLSAEEQARRNAERRRWKVAWGFSAAGTCLGIALLRWLGVDWEEFWVGPGVVALLCLIFGAWACFLIRETLPDYYDRNKVSFYADGAFRMNLPGVYFNNRNWPHIVKVLRLWLLVSPVVFSPVYAVLRLIVPAACGDGWKLVLTLLACLGVFVPTVVVGRRYS